MTEEKSKSADATLHFVGIIYACLVLEYLCKIWFSLFQREKVAYSLLSLKAAL